MELNYKSMGEGPALVILHGLFGSLDNWQTLARRYAEHFSVFIVDQRNHGKSPHSNDPFNYPQLAQDLYEFLDQQGIYEAHLLGHSMGGKTVMQFAAEHEDLIDKMVVADMGIRQYGPHHTLILETLDAFPFADIHDRKAAEAWLAPRITDFGVRQFLLKNLLRDSKGAHEFRWKFNFPTLQRDYDEILKAVESDYQIQTPTLFISGGQSNYVRPEDHDDIRVLFPNAAFDSIPEAGHWLHAERPQEFLQQTLAFLLDN